MTENPLLTPSQSLLLHRLNYLLFKEVLFAAGFLQNTINSAQLHNFFYQFVTNSGFWNIHSFTVENVAKWVIIIYDCLRMVFVYITSFLQFSDSIEATIHALIYTNNIPCVVNTDGHHELCVEIVIEILDAVERDNTNQSPAYHALRAVNRAFRVWLEHPLVPPGTVTNLQ